VSELYILQERKVECSRGVQPSLFLTLKGTTVVSKKSFHLVPESRWIFMMPTSLQLHSRPITSCPYGKRIGSCI